MDNSVWFFKFKKLILAVLTIGVSSAQEHLGELFSDKRSRDKEQEEQTELVERLYQQIGQLQVELNWLKKKLAKPSNSNLRLLIDS